MVRSSYGGGRFGRYSGAGGQDAAVLAVSMKLDDIAVTMAIAAGGAWVGTLARELSQERRKISWKMMMLETPGALVCGFGAGGLADALGFHSPLVVAGAGAVAGRIGAAVFVQVLLTFLQKRMSDNGRDS